MTVEPVEKKKRGPYGPRKPKVELTEVEAEKVETQERTQAVKSETKPDGYFSKAADEKRRKRAEKLGSTWKFAGESVIEACEVRLLDALVSREASNRGVDASALKPARDEIPRMRDVRCEATNASVLETIATGVGTIGAYFTPIDVAHPVFEATVQIGAGFAAYGQAVSAALAGVKL